jgi:hypothetical protein
MKIDLTTMYKLGLTPNGIYLLFCLKKQIEPRLINTALESGLLEKNGFIDHGNLTTKSLEVLAKAQYLGKSKTSRDKLSDEDVPFIEKYRSLFPAGKFPSGAAARSSVNELRPRFEVFFSKLPEYKDWSLVLQATALYLDDAEHRNWEFTQSSENFIYKLDQYKVWKSTLAKYCQMTLDGNAEYASAAVPSIVNIPGLVNDQ